MLSGFEILESRNKENIEVCLLHWTQKLKQRELNFLWIIEGTNLYPSCTKRVANVPGLWVVLHHRVVSFYLVAFARAHSRLGVGPLHFPAGKNRKGKAWRRWITIKASQFGISTDNFLVFHALFWHLSWPYAQLQH